MRFKGPEPIFIVLLAPAGLILVGELIQGKPWAMLFWALRATQAD